MNADEKNAMLLSIRQLNDTKRELEAQLESIKTSLKVLCEQASKEGLRDLGNGYEIKSKVTYDISASALREKYPDTYKEIIDTLKADYEPTINKTNIGKALSKYSTEFRVRVITDIEDREHPTTTYFVQKAVAKQEEE